MIKNETDRYPSWQSSFLAFNQHPFIQHMYVLSFALIGVSLLYLVAANWFMLPSFVQLATPQVMLFIAALASLYVQKEYLIQTLHSFCGLMLGLSLAVIGQVYQTGADSYLLFTVWAVLLIPWLYRKNIGIFVLLSVVSQLALYLGFKQTFWMQEAELLYFVLLSVLTIFQFYLCLKIYPAVRYFFIVWVGVLSIWMMLKYMGSDGGVYFIFSVALPLLYFAYFFKQKEMLASSLTLVSVGLSLTFWILENLGATVGRIGVEIFFINALVVFVWFALISYLLIKMLPQNRFYILPLAVGAWIAGLILASAVLTLWGAFSLVMGLVFIIVAAILLKKQQGAFIRQLAYCLLLSGQVAFLGHLLNETHEVSLLLLCQLPLFILFFYLRTHWFFMFIQFLAIYGLAVASIFSFHDYYISAYSTFYEFFFICNYLFFALFFVSGTLKNSTYRRSVMAALLVICIASAFIAQIETHWMHTEAQTVIWMNYLLPIVWGVFCFFVFLSKQLKPIASVMWVLFSLILIDINAFEIAIVLCILAWAIQQKDKIVYTLSLVVFTLLLWHMYYSLELSFLLKSLTLFLSGLFLYAFAYFLASSTSLTVREQST